MLFYSHVIYLGTKIRQASGSTVLWFYSHVIYLGTKIEPCPSTDIAVFYSHVIYLGTKIFCMFLEKVVCFTVT